MRDLRQVRNQSDPRSLDPTVERIEKSIAQLEGRIEELAQWLTAGLSSGVPIDILSDGSVGGPTLRHMRGNWVTLTLTAATGSVTCTHNLDIPTTSVTGAGGTANLPNVRWEVRGLEYGDRTGTNAAPAVPAGAFAVEFIKMVNATVTRDAIDLRYAVTGFTPSATEPLSVTLWFMPAVQ